MRRHFKVLAAAVGAVFVLGAFGVGAAFAAEPPAGTTNYHDVLVGKVASILGVDQSKLTDAFTQARNDTIDQAVKDGRITSDQAKLIKDRVAQVQADGGPAGFAGGPGRGGRFGAPFAGTSGTTPWGTPPWAATPAPAQ